MGTDRLLWSVPDFPRDLALTNDFRTVALYHSLLTTHHSQPLLSSHIGSRSEEPSIVSRPRPWTRPWREREEERERERVREKRERKWGLTGSCGLYPIFARRPVLRKGRRKWGLTGSYGLYPIFARRGERKRLVRILALS